MKKRTVLPICAAADREKAAQIMALLEKRGLARPGGRGEEKTPGKGDVVLLLLSQNFAADEEAQARFFAADSAGVSVIPVDLDGSGQSDLVKSALIARNAITAQGRTDEEIAERVASAFQTPPPPSVLPRVLAAAAVVLALGVGLWLWLGRGTQTRVEEGPALPAMAESELAAAKKLGLTAEDLATITSFGIVGDKIDYGSMRLTTNSDIGRNGRGFFLGSVAYENWDWETETNHWYSTEDGHEFTLTRYEDLSIIEWMPNLRELTLVMVDCDKLPALSGLEKLETVTLSDCRIPDYSWLEGARMLAFNSAYCGVEDLSPIASCARLREMDLELFGQSRAELSAACAESLHNVSIRGGDGLREADLSGLSSALLWELHLIELPISDLSFLRGQDSLSQLELYRLPQLRDVGPIGDLSSLSRIWIKDLQNVNDLTALGRCARLQSVEVENMRQIRDLRVLNNCKSLQRVYLNNMVLDDLSFMETAAKNFGVEFGFSGRAGDYSALSAVNFFASLELNPENQSLADILPCISNSTVGRLRICNVRGLDLSALPKVSSRLELCDCRDLADLSGLDGKQSFCELELQNLPMLRSLDGVDKVDYFGETDMTFNCTLRVDNCPRLSDWSALDNKKLGNIQLCRVFTLPDFSRLHYNPQTSLRLENIPDVTDLSIFEGIKQPQSIYFNFELVGLDDLRDLSALKSFRGDRLVVTPELEPYAAALVESGNFKAVGIEYPAGGWDNDYNDLTLLSLDELETMPPAMLRRVTRLCLAGDRVVDADQYHIENRWNGRSEEFLLVDNNTGEETELQTGSLKDLSLLAPLTGLRDLRIYAQPLESLDGVQDFGELETLDVECCQKLKDPSAAFTLQSLSWLKITNGPLASIQGVQNLTELRMLEFYSTDLKDVSPLAELDSSASMDRGGFELSLGGTNCADYSAIGSIPVFRRLDLNSADCSKWLGVLDGREVYSLSAHGSHMDQAQFEALLAAHPELEELQIPYNNEITDLTPLLEMENLRQLLVNRDMKQAVASLDGKDLPFELEIW